MMLSIVFVSVKDPCKDTLKLENTSVLTDDRQLSGSESVGEEAAGARHKEECEEAESYEDEP